MKTLNEDIRTDVEKYKAQRRQRRETKEYMATMSAALGISPHVLEKPFSVEDERKLDEMAEDEPEISDYYRDNTYMHNARN